MTLLYFNPYFGPAMRTHIVAYVGKSGGVYTQCGRVLDNAWNDKPWENHADDDVCKPCKAAARKALA